MVLNEWKEREKALFSKHLDAIRKKCPQTNRALYTRVYDELHPNKEAVTHESCAPYRD